MTKQEMFDAALARAVADGCLIQGSGVVKSGEHRGCRVWSVLGKNASHAYLVVQVNAMELRCSCPSRVPCKHRAVVSARIQAERAEAQAVAVKVAADRQYFRDLQWSETVASW